MPRRHRFIRDAATLAAAVILAGAAAAAQTAEPPSGAAYSGRDQQLRATVPRIEADVRIDGVLDEAPWAQASRLTEFSAYSPVDGRPAGDVTEVLVWYSPTAIYFGIRAHAATGAVHATLADRDKIDADDSIQIFLNPFNDARQAFVFGVNPLGVQADGILVEGTGNRGGAAFSALASGREVVDLTPDYVYESKGRVTGEGYEIELAIPFKTLRFPSDRTQHWGINVVRRVQSDGREDTWTPAHLDQSSFLAQSGTLDGLTDLRRGLVLDVTPVVTAKADGAPIDDGWGYTTSRPEPGASVRWGVTPTLTLTGTVNPDFSQVEADAGQFVFDPRSAVFFPEKRPFFLEGAELFAAPNNLIYPRRILAPVAAAKLTGRVAGANVGVISAVDGLSASSSGLDHPVFNIARVQRDVRGTSSVGLAYTDRVDGADSNRVLAADARLVFGPLYSLRLQAGASRTRTAERTTTAPLWQAIFSRDGHAFGYRYTLTGIHDDFQAGSGFISRGGIIHANLTHRGTWFGGKDAALQSWTTAAQVDGIWQYRAVTVGEPWLEKKLHFNNTFVFKGGWRAGASALFESFAFDPVLYADYALPAPGGGIMPFTGTPYLRNADYVITLDTPKFSRFSGSVFALWGRDENFHEWSAADIVFATYALDWRPSHQLRVSPQYQLQQYRRAGDGSIVGRRRIPRLKIEYQVTRPIFVRVIGEYDARNRDALRDDSRTNLPILLRDSETGLYRPAPASQTNVFRIEWLFSYQPTPGTVFFAGYSSALTEPDGLTFRHLRRSSDGLFVKLSYLFRL